MRNFWEREGALPQTPAKGQSPLCNPHKFPAFEGNGKTYAS